MAIQVEDIISRVRSEILIDTDAEAYRWTDAVLESFVKHTINDLLKLRPHLLISSDGLPMSSEVLKESPSLIPSKYEDALVHGVASLAFLQDSADQNNASRASYELAKFKECAGLAAASA